MTTQNQKMTNQKKQSDICKSCGECCKHLGIEIPRAHATSYVLEFFKARGFKLKQLKKDTAYLWADIKCPQLTKDGCAIYDRRPQACKDYDGTKDPNINCPLKEKQWTTKELTAPGAVTTTAIR